MITFHLMDSIVERRFIIDTRLHAGSVPCRTVDARSWLEAKRAFGFALTAAQELLLQRQGRA